MASDERLGPPVDGVDGRPLTSGRIEQPGVPEPEPFDGSHFYAWGKIGRILIQRPLRVAFEQTPTDLSFRHLDVFSSTPWLREVMRDQIARHYYLPQANSVINSFDTDFRRRVFGVYPGIKKMRQEKINEVRKILLGEGLLEETLLPRQILQAAVFELLFDPEQAGIMTQREGVLAEYFLKRFNDFPARYLTVVTEGPIKGDTGIWKTVVIDEAQISLSNIIGSLTDITGPGRLTPAEADDLLKSMAKHFAHQLSSRIQPAPKFMSLDMEDAALFGRFAYKNFPWEAFKTIFFKRVLDPERHVVGDARNLDGFEDGSISVYSAIEGFPFYAEYFSESEGVQIISEAWRILRVGGKLIMFPWVARNGMDLGVYQEALRRLGFRVVIENKSKESLLRNMSERELKLMKLSPVFTTDPNREFFPCLYATKKG